MRHSPEAGGGFVPGGWYDKSVVPDSKNYRSLLGCSDELSATDRWQLLDTLHAQALNDPDLAMELVEYAGSPHPGKKNLFVCSIALDAGLQGLYYADLNESARPLLSHEKEIYSCAQTLIPAYFDRALHEHPIGHPEEKIYRKFFAVMAMDELEGGSSQGNEPRLLDDILEADWETPLAAGMLLKEMTRGRSVKILGELAGSLAQDALKAALNFRGVDYYQTKDGRSRLFHFLQLAATCLPHGKGYLSPINRLYESLDPGGFSAMYFGPGDPSRYKSQLDKQLRAIDVVDSYRTPASALATHPDSSNDYPPVDEDGPHLKPWNNRSRYAPEGNYLFAANVNQLDDDFTFLSVMTPPELEVQAIDGARRLLADTVFYTADLAEETKEIDAKIRLLGGSEVWLGWSDGWIVVNGFRIIMKRGIKRITNPATRIIRAVDAPHFVIYDFQSPDPHDRLQVTRYIRPWGGFNRDYRYEYYGGGRRGVQASIDNRWDFAPSGVSWINHPRPYHRDSRTNGNFSVRVDREGRAPHEILPVREQDPTRPIGTVSLDIGSLNQNGSMGSIIGAFFARSNALRAKSVGEAPSLNHITSFDQRWGIAKHFGEMAVRALLDMEAHVVDNTNPPRLFHDRPKLISAWKKRVRPENLV